MLHVISLHLLVLQLLWIFLLVSMFLIKSLFSFQRYIQQREQCCRQRRQQNEWGYIDEECRMTKRLLWKKEISSSKMNADRSGTKIKERQRVWRAQHANGRWDRDRLKAKHPFELHREKHLAHANPLEEHWKRQNPHFRQVHGKRQWLCRNSQQNSTSSEKK